MPLFSIAYINSKPLGGLEGSPEKAGVGGSMCRFANYLAHSCSDYLAHYRSYCTLADPEERLKPRIAAVICMPQTFSPPLRSRCAK